MAGTEAISKLIDAYAKTHMQELKGEETKTGKTLSKYEIAQKMVKEGQLSKTDFNVWSASGEGFKSLSNAKSGGVFGFGYLEDLGTGDTVSFKATKKEQAMLDKVHKDTYAPKKYTLPSGRYVVYQTDEKTGSKTYKYYAADGTELKPEYFMKKEPKFDKKQLDKPLEITSKQAEPKSKLRQVGEQFIKEFKTDAALLKDGKVGEFVKRHPVSSAILGAGTAAVAVAAAPAGAATAAGALALASCEKEGDTIYNNTIDVDVTNKITVQQQAVVDAINQGVKDIIAAINGKNETLEAYLNDIMSLLDTQLNKITANEEQLKQMMQQMLTSLEDGNTTLKNIETLLTTLKGDSSKALKEIYEAIATCKYSIEQNGTKLDALNSTVAEINNSIKNLPDDLKATFADQFQAILTSIADNGKKLDALNVLLRIINNNVKAGNKEIITRMGNIQNTLNAILDKAIKQDGKTDDIVALLQTIANNQNINGDKLDAILKAIDKLGVSTAVGINKIIAAITNSNQNTTTKLDALMKLLGEMKAENAEQNAAILSAIDKLGTDMTSNFTQLLKIQDKLLKQGEDGNKTLNEILKLVKNFNDVDLSSIKKAIETATSALQETINTNSNNLYLQLVAMNGALGTINANVEQLGKNQKDIAQQLTFLTQLIVGKADDPDFPSVMGKLDAIIDAIKNHQIEIQVDVKGHFTCCCSENGDQVNEGIIDDINWLLGN